MVSLTKVEECRTRAVSPVIGVILMVAITVILAAVIGAFVLEIGDQQETAPSTSFDSEQAEQFFEGVPNNMANMTKVSISHAGGEVIDVTSAEIVVEGNESVWTDNGHINGEGSHITVRPNPDFTQTLGTNQRATFTSGEEWGTLTYGGSDIVSETWYNSGIWNDEYVKKPNPGSNNFYHMRLSSSEFDDGLFPIVPEGIDMPEHEDDGNNPTQIVTGYQLESGDQVNVVWEASSGGKTQTLFKYTVQ